MPHDDQRMQLDKDGDPAEDTLEQDRHRQDPGCGEQPAREPLDTRRPDRRGQGHEPDHEADPAIPELDQRVVVLLRQERAPAARPVLATEARAGETDGRAPDDDEEEGGESEEAQPVEERRRRGAKPEPREPARAGFRHRTTSTPFPSSTRPTSARKRSSAWKLAERTALRSGGRETSRPPDVWGSKASVARSSGRPSRVTKPATYSRLR